MYAAHEHINENRNASTAETWHWFARTINWEADHLTELKPPRARGSSSARLSNEGHSCTSEHYRCFTGTIKPEPALPRSTHTALSHIAAPQSPIGCYNTVADAAASGPFYSLSLSPPSVSPRVHLSSIVWALFRTFRFECCPLKCILENDSQDPCQEWSLGILIRPMSSLLCQYNSAPLLQSWITVMKLRSGKSITV